MSELWAPDNAEGMHAYLVIKADMWDIAAGRDYRRIEYAESLKDAKRMYGWTRQAHTTIKVRRAVPGDLSPLDTTTEGTA